MYWRYGEREARVLHGRRSEICQQVWHAGEAKNSDVPVQSPWLPIVNKQALIMLRAGQDLGFSPASRTRIAMGDGVEQCGAWDDVAV